VGSNKAVKLSNRFTHPALTPAFTAGVPFVPLKDFDTDGLEFFFSAIAGVMVGFAFFLFHFSLPLNPLIAEIFQVINSNTMIARGIVIDPDTQFLWHHSI